MAKRVVIAGGGTGGHLYPGIALARALMRSDMDIEITFVGTRQGIESKILPREGFNLKTIFSAGLLGKKGLNRWVSWCKLPAGTAQSMCFLIRNRPNLVVGVGGYASAPLVFSAWLLRIPILIHEQNDLFAEDEFAYINESLVRVQEIFVKIIVQGISAGEFRSNIDPKFVYRMMMDVMGAVQRGYDPKVDSEREVVERWLDVFLRGISGEARS